MPAIETSPFFCVDETHNIFALDAKKLDQRECNVFFPIIDCKALLTITALEHFAFSPEREDLNAKFKLDKVSINGGELFWCRFPKEFKDTCVRVAETYGRTVTNSKGMAIGTRTSLITIHFPQADNILLIEGSRPTGTAGVNVMNKQMIMKEAKDFAKENARILEAAKLFENDTAHIPRVACGSEDF